MARPIKQGLDYFSHDVNLSDDMKLKFLQAKYKLEGYATYLKLLEIIYREKGYFMRWDEDTTLLFSNDNSIDINVCNNIINECINRDLFNINLFNEYNILTSLGIQKRYLRGVHRRKEIELVKNFVLLDVEKFAKSENLELNIVFVDINEVNVHSNFNNVSDKTQIKLNKSTVHKSTLNNSTKGGKKTPPSPKDITKRDIEFKNKLSSYLGTYSKEMLEAFYLYWSEMNEGGKKMRFEMQKTFDIAKRLKTWSNNDKKWSKSGKEGTTLEELRRIAEDF